MIYEKLHFILDSDIFDISLKLLFSRIYRLSSKLENIISIYIFIQKPIEKYKPYTNIILTF